MMPTPLSQMEKLAVILGIFSSIGCLAYVTALAIGADPLLGLNKYAFSSILGSLVFATVVISSLVFTFSLFEGRLPEGTKLNWVWRGKMVPQLLWLICIIGIFLARWGTLTGLVVLDWFPELPPAYVKALLLAPLYFLAIAFIASATLVLRKDAT